MPEPTVARSVFIGPGKIIQVHVNGHVYPSILANAGKTWVLIASLSTGEPITLTESSLISILKKTIDPMTTNGFRHFLFIFGLTLQDVFDDNPEKTTTFIEKVCEELSENVKTQEQIGPHTLRNLSELVASLVSEASQALKKVIETTITKLQGLPKGPPMSATRPKQSRKQGH